MVAKKNIYRHMSGRMFRPMARLWVECRETLINILYCLSQTGFYLCCRIGRIIQALGFGGWHREHSIPIGLRLKSKWTPGDQGREIYWTDAEENEHPMIVLSIYRDMEEEKEAQESDWYEVYRNEIPSYIYEGLKMSDLELNLWLQGWHLDQVNEESQQQKGSSAL